MQTSGKSLELNENNFVAFMEDMIARIDMKAAKKDVERFLEEKSELELFNIEVLTSAIKSVYS